MLANPRMHDRGVVADDRMITNFNISPDDTKLAYPDIFSDFCIRMNAVFGNKIVIA